MRVLRGLIRGGLLGLKGRLLVVTTAAEPVSTKATSEASRRFVGLGVEADCLEVVLVRMRVGRTLAEPAERRTRLSGTEWNAVGRRGLRTAALVKVCLFHISLQRLRLSFRRVPLGEARDTGPGPSCSEDGNVAPVTGAVRPQVLGLLLVWVFVIFTGIVGPGAQNCQ